MSAAHHRLLRRGVGNSKKHQLGLVGDVVSSVVDTVLGSGSTTTPAANPPADSTSPSNPGSPTTSSTQQPGNTSQGRSTNTPSPESTASIGTVSGAHVGSLTSTSGTAGVTTITTTGADGMLTTMTTHIPTSATASIPGPDDTDLGTGASSSGSGTLAGADPGPSNTDSATALGNGRGGVTGGVVVAILIAVLFIIGLVVFILRKRVKARRDEENIKWGFTRSRSSQLYADDKEAMLSGPSSRRSSFGTSVDHSNIPCPPISPPPPMAEIGRASGTAPTLVLDINADHNRFSVGSAGSHNSQFLVVHHRESLVPDAAPSISACMASFSFPKPPIPTVDRSSTHSRHSDRPRNDSSGKVNNPPSPIKEDDDQIIYIASPSGPPLQKPLIPTAVQVESSPVVITNPFADNNPFEDPTPKLQVSDIEVVQRPFAPQLQDELRVEIGDFVRILEVFDDGWALVERIFAPTPPAKLESEQGLIPLDCLRESTNTAGANVQRLSSQTHSKAA